MVRMLHQYFKNGGLLNTSNRFLLQQRNGALNLYFIQRQNLGCTVIRSCVNSREQSSPVRVRFAPSPTGELHLGGFRTALYNYLFAKKHGGQFLLRIEDTDQTRLVPGAAQKLETILDWLHTPPDESPTKGGEAGPYVQSQRLHLYNKHVNEMIANGSAYRCFCTEKRLEILRKESAKMRVPNIYDRRCMNLTESEIEEKLASRASFTVRFKLTPFQEGFKDMVYGEVHHDVHSLEGDPIIMKSDGYPTYHLANVVDDHLMNISHVLRGVEWQVSTPKHILMYRALGWTPPQFGHLPLILNADGSKLSKRQNDMHIRTLQEASYDPVAILNFVTLLGGGFDKEYSLKNIFTTEELITHFDASKINTNGGRIEMERLAEINNNLLKQKFSSNKNEFLQECKAYILASYNEADVNTNLEVKISWALDRIKTIKDLIKSEFLFLWNINTTCLEEFTCDIKVLSKVIDIFSNSNDFKSFQNNIRKYCKEQNLKMPMIMKDVRIMLTGKSEGPPIKEIVDLIGKNSCLQRMKISLS